MAVNDIPGRAFLDTCVVNFILDHGEEIHDGAAPAEGTEKRIVQDIKALYNIFLTGQRASWQLAMSPHTYQEIEGTQDGYRRYQLERWFEDIWQYWRDIVRAGDDLPTFMEAEEMRIRFLGSGLLDVLPDLVDRVLLCDAIVYNCELFCTLDWSTILRHRSGLKELPLDIVTPTEWWSRLEPHVRLWA